MHQDIHHFRCLESPSLPCSSSSSQESSQEIVKVKKKKIKKIYMPSQTTIKTLPLTSPMKKQTKHSIFPASSSPIPSKKSAQSKQRAATTQFVDIEREVLSSGTATSIGNAASLEEYDE